MTQTRHQDGVSSQRYLLNAPVLTSYGDFRFEGPLSLQAAREFAARNAHSAIGHAATASLMSQCLGVAVPSQRDAVRMEPGDQALVFRMLGRLPQGVELDADALSALPYEFGLLTRLR